MTGSQRAVDLVRRAMEAWNREDIDELIPLSDPEVAFVSIFAGMEGRTYRGYRDPDEALAAAGLRHRRRDA